MNQLKNKTVQLILLAFLLTNLLTNHTLYSQAVFSITSGESASVYAQLDLTYANQIDVPADTLAQHLSHLLQRGTYDPSLAAPHPYLTETDQNTLALSWGSIAGASNYTISAFNLFDGASSLYHPTDTSITLDSLATELYLISLLSEDGTEQSALRSIVVDLRVNYIIVDAEILMQSPIKDELTCQCTPTDSATHLLQGGLLGTINLAWNELATLEKQQIELTGIDDLGTHSSVLLPPPNDRGSGLYLLPLGLCGRLFQCGSLPLWATRRGRVQPQRDGNSPAFFVR